VCFFRALRRKKDFPQVPHEKGRSPVCTLMWTLKLLLRLNFFPQVLQTNGFSPVCVLMWFTRLRRTLKPFPHVGHTNGTSTARHRCEPAVQSNAAFTPDAAGAAEAASLHAKSMVDARQGAAKGPTERFEQQAQRVLSS
uniref:Uncharacterized protein n=1 Tax=Cyprinodon variegatus TaxID=28743 RepID=A0A3Q2DAL7_CYPVA